MFFYVKEQLEKTGGSCFFLGSTEEILKKIIVRALLEYPNVKVGSYSPPYKTEFTATDNKVMIQAVNAFAPDGSTPSLLFRVRVGKSSAPKQEKWAYRHLEQLRQVTYVA